MTMTTTTTMTMTHSDCLQRSQKPCPTDVSEGVMTPEKRICRTVYCPAQRTELETSCDVRWHCLKSKKKLKIYTGLRCTKLCELKETERILGFWSTAYPLRDQFSLFCIHALHVQLAGRYRNQARHRAASGTREATWRARTWSQVASPLVGQGWSTRRSVSVELLSPTCHRFSFKSATLGQHVVNLLIVVRLPCPVVAKDEATNTKVVWSCLLWRSRLSPLKVGMIACARWCQCHCADPVSSSQHTCFLRLALHFSSR